MKDAPLILLSPSTQEQGVEFSDLSISLSNRYSEAILAGGGVPWILPCAPERELVAECVRRADGLLLTGGSDVQTKLYQPAVTPAMKKTVGPPDAPRDLLELQLIDEVFRQRKPLLAICRGQQILNVALGGTLIVDIPSQRPDALNHNQPAKKFQPVHTAAVTPDSRLARVLGQRRIAVNSTHHQAVDRVAKLLKVTATSADGVIEALELNDGAATALPYLVAVQFHPERLYSEHQEFLNLFRDFIRACLPKRHS
ncbi:MAG: gamma-glutamyl-gamma-aminobutyrate hydrolase family protein [Verrucomicrobia bacterium]|nr:gamma-glutamyl-gamma-aminobutyrate hydrolase family protein [Verrucomicrobiota bacterium]